MLARHELKLYSRRESWPTVWDEIAVERQNVSRMPTPPVLRRWAWMRAAGCVRARGRGRARRRVESLKRDEMSGRRGHQDDSTCGTDRNV